MLSACVGQRNNIALLLDMHQFLAGRRDPSKLEAGSFWTWTFWKGRCGQLMHWKETTRHSQVQKDSAWLNWESLSNSEQWEEATLKLQTFKEIQKDILNNSILSFHILHHGWISESLSQKGSVWLAETCSILVALALNHWTISIQIPVQMCIHARRSGHTRLNKIQTTQHLQWFRFKRWQVCSVLHKRERGPADQ